MRTIVPIEVKAEDLRDLGLEDDEQSETYGNLELNLGRRSVALFIDTFILLALHFFLIYLCAQIIGYSYRDLLRQAWQPFVGVFLLFHFVYYIYFYRTSRQTPGQVFVAIELRDPMSGAVSSEKIIIRWTVMIFFNVFNFLPLLERRRYLLLDRLSKTEIRKLR